MTESSSPSRCCCCWCCFASVPLSQVDNIMLCYVILCRTRRDTYIKKRFQKLVLKCRRYLCVSCDPSARLSHVQLSVLFFFFTRKTFLSVKLFRTFICLLFSACATVWHLRKSQIEIYGRSHRGENKQCQIRDRQIGNRTFNVLSQQTTSSNYKMLY
jgi:hypothetical protein